MRDGVRRVLAVRAVRHGLVTTGLVLAVCLGVVGVSAASYLDTSRHVARLTARGIGEITHVGVGGNESAVQVDWMLATGGTATAVVPLAVSPPPVGTRTEIAYDPSQPGDAVVPGAALLADVDRAQSGLTLPPLVILVVLVVGGWRLVTRARLRRRTSGAASMRRLRVQRGLMVRSWLETEGGPTRWIPVYFDPVLVTMPSPARVEVYGDVRRDRLVAVEVAGTMLYPSGPVTASEPKGRRIDNPARPDKYAAGRAAGIGRLRRQFRVDSAAMVAAPIVGLFWSFLDGSGFAGWLATTLVVAALALWLGAIRGSDPS